MEVVGGWVVVVGGNVVVGGGVVVAGEVVGGREVVGGTELVVCGGREEVREVGGLVLRQPATKAVSVRASAITRTTLLNWKSFMFPPKLGLQ